MKIALIGTGMMGERMGGRMLDAGHELAVHNRTRAHTAALEARGAAVADTPRVAAEGAEFPITMLADAHAVRHGAGRDRSSRGAGRQTVGRHVDGVAGGVPRAGRGSPSSWGARAQRPGLGRPGCGRQGHAGDPRGRRGIWSCRSPRP